MDSKVEDALVEVWGQEHQVFTWQRPKDKGEIRLKGLMMRVFDLRVRKISREWY